MRRILTTIGIGALALTGLNTSASARPHDNIHVGTYRVCTDSDDTLIVGYNVEKKSGIDWGFEQDRGFVQKVQVFAHDVHYGKNGKWIEVKSVSGGEGVRRVKYEDYNFSQYDLVRVVFIDGGYRVRSAARPSSGVCAR
jgi:hypothetical protein